MPIYCQSCGRTVPDDANICPYCSAAINKAQAVHAQQPIYPPEQKKDKTILIVVVVIVVVILLVIGIAATVYVYVSGFTSRPSMATPNVSLVAETGAGSSSNDVVITAAAITESGISWYQASYTLVDITDSEELDEYIDFRVTEYLYGTISGGDTIEIAGLNGELEENHQYRFTLNYDPTGGAMGTVTWTQ